MANRMISRIKNVNIKFIEDANAIKGIASVKINEEDLEEILDVDEDENLKAEYLSKAGKCAVAAAVIESSYKAASLVEIANREGLKEAERRWRSQAGLPTSDDSLHDVEDKLKATLRVLDDDDDDDDGVVDKSSGDQGSGSDGE